MAAYWIAHVNVTNPDAYEGYKDRAPKAIAKYGGKFLARGGPYQLMEGGPDYARNVIIEFPSREQAIACHGSPEYQEAASFRRGAGDVTIVIVEGVD